MRPSSSPSCTPLLLRSFLKSHLFLWDLPMKVFCPVYPPPFVNFWPGPFLFIREVGQNLWHMSPLNVTSPFSFVILIALDLRSSINENTKSPSGIYSLFYLHLRCYASFLSKGCLVIPSGSSPLPCTLSNEFPSVCLWSNSMVWLNLFQSLFFDGVGPLLSTVFSRVSSMLTPSP